MSSDAASPVQRILLAGLFAYIICSVTACGFQAALERKQVGDLGYFEYRGPQPHMTGIVIAAPHGLISPDAVTLAAEISERAGAGFVAAYGFKSKRISVTQPISRLHAPPLKSFSSAKRGSVFREFNQLLGKVGNGEIDLYLELRVWKGNDEFQAIEVASSGFTFEEAREIEQIYAWLADGRERTRGIAKLPLRLDYSRNLSSVSWGMRHHGVLMRAEKGLSLRIPEKFLAKEDLMVCAEILSAWVKEITRLLHENPRGVPEMKVKVLELGRFDTIPPRAGIPGFVIGAPHGSYDAYTAGVAKQLAFRTGWAAVIARGFTPTESRDGRRINVNRPSERRIWLGEWDFESERARTIYTEFKKAVLSAAHGSLDLYIDIHQNDGSKIEVASLGVSREQARSIKDAYRSARDQRLRGRPDIGVVELAIEPLDQIEVGAWAAKSDGILGVAHRSLHFELPANGVMSSARQREIYTKVLGKLLAKLPTLLATSAQQPGDIVSRSKH